MLFNEDEDYLPNYVPVILNGYKLLMYKSVIQWEICLRTNDTDDGYSERIGLISTSGLKGTLDGATNLAWVMYPDHKGLGIMKEALCLFVNEYVPEPNGFAVAIQPQNISSIKVALNAGFKVYYENEDIIYLSLKP